MSSVSRRTCLAVFVLAAAWLAADAAMAHEKTVKLTIDYGDGVQKVFVELPWNAEMTVFTALQAAQKHPRGIKVVHQGTGERILVTAIDDLANEGDGRNWTYQVNAKLADKSAGVYKLAAGDAVLWRFAKYR